MTEEQIEILWILTRYGYAGFVKQEDQNGEGSYIVSLKPSIEPPEQLMIKVKQVNDTAVLDRYDKYDSPWKDLSFWSIHVNFKN